MNIWFHFSRRQGWCDLGHGLEHHASCIIDQFLRKCQGHLVIPSPWPLTWDLKSLEKSWDLTCIHQNRTVYFIMMMLISTVFSWKQLNCDLFLTVGLFDEFNNCLWLKYYLWHLLLTRSMFLNKNHACRPINLKPQVLTLKHGETHGCVVSTVATDALVLKHQTISIYNAD